MRTFLLCLFAAALACGQSDPQFVWEGSVDGTSILHVRGNRIDIEDKQGAPVQRDRHRFFERLPETRQDVQMQVVQARGRVRIVQQPRPDNNYTLSVAIEDSQGGPGFYSLAFFWQSSGRSGGILPFPSANPRPYSSRNPGRDEDRLTWTGRVDNEVIIECRAQDCRARELRGQPVSRDRFQFTRALPEREVRVSLDDVQGRGEVQLIEQPGPGNNYTAKIRIRDSEGGADDYGFALFWNRPRQSEPNRLFARPGMHWQARVDGSVRVTIDGTQVNSQVLSGSPLEGERFNFLRPLPREATPNATAKRVRGRGRVEIVEYPSNRNGYRLTFQVEDSSGGADNYEVEIGW